jgi:hypothetical protein
MSIEEDFQHCARLFVDRDYAGRASMAGSMLQTVSYLQLFQLYLISLQRMEDHQRLEVVGPEILESTSADTWTNALLRITLGQADLDQVFPLIQNVEKQCQFAYYMGARSLTDGRWEDARPELRGCERIDYGERNPESGSEQRAEN